MKLDVRWTADYRDHTHLSVQYCPVIDGMDYGMRASLHKSLQLSPFPEDISGDLRIMAELVDSTLRRPRPVIEGRTCSIQPHVIERTVTGTYLGEASSCWLRYYFAITHPLGAYQNDAAQWEEAELSDVIRTVVRRVDEFAVSKAASHWADHYNAFAEREDVASFLPEPINIFISYQSQLASAVLAQRMHDALSAPGDATFFRTFLDKPDLGPGDWRAQLQAELNSADVFMPLLALDYLTSEVALWELEIAERAATAGNMHIIPVLTEGTWHDYPRLRHLQGVQIPMDADDQLFDVQLGRVRSLAVAAAAVRRRKHIEQPRK